MQERFGVEGFAEHGTYVCARPTGLLRKASGSLVPASHEPE